LLHVSRATAKRHTENILQKLGLHSRSEVERVIGGV
jgi:DNA-binding NarL/FixJ family response regulator